MSSLSLPKPKRRLLITSEHAENPVLFAPQEVANDVSRTFGLALTVAGVPGVLPTT